MIMYKDGIEICEHSYFWICSVLYNIFSIRTIYKLLGEEINIVEQNLPRVVYIFFSSMLSIQSKLLVFEKPSKMTGI